MRLSGCDTGYQTGQLAITQPCVTIPSQDADCVNNEGKFYDRTTEDFIVPVVGAEAYIHLCNGALWTKDVWIVINLIGNQFAIFKITNAGNNRIKILNGLDKSGDAPIYGNPVAGTLIPSGSIFYAVVPGGSDSMFATKVINILENQGVASVMKILTESENICFTNVPTISDIDGDGHLFAGTKPDCDCDSGSAIMSCFRKLMKILTGASGTTLCFPNVSTTTSTDVTGKPVKRIAVYDENSCLKKGTALADLDACGSLAVNPSSTKFDALISCAGGVKKSILAVQGFNIYAVPVNNTLPNGSYQWVQAKAGLQFFPLDAPAVVKSSTGSSTTTMPSFPHANCFAVFKLEFNDDGSTQAYSLVIEGETVVSGRLYSSAIKIDTAVPMVKLLTATPTIIWTHPGAASTSISLIGYFANYPAQ